MRNLDKRTLSLKSFVLQEHSGYQVTYAELPVKLIPARSGESVIVSPNSGPAAGTKLITPGGTPASLNILNMVQLDNIAVSDGFQTVAFPIRVGVAPRLAPIAVKLKGEMEAMKPSRPRQSMRFQTLGEWTVGWPCTSIKICSTIIYIHRAAVLYQLSYYS